MAALTIVLAQCNFTVGDITANSARIAMCYERAVEARADLIVFSEMAITGYPPEDLVLRERFRQTAMDAVNQLAALTTQGPAILMGGLWCESDMLYNAAFLIEGGHIVTRQHKHHLPNYGVFDEKRLFAKGPMHEPIRWRGIQLGILICEDMWEADVAGHLKSRGAELLISINASPYEMGKAKQRHAVGVQRTHETSLPLIYVNQVGGQDELVFDGRSFVLSRQGDVCVGLGAFEEDFAVTRWQKEQTGWVCEMGKDAPHLSDEETIYRALVLGLRDFVHKNGFTDVVLGMSGGIDSALSAAVAVDALGSDQVLAVMMPSPFTSQDSLEDAAECCKRLNVRLDTISIEAAMKAFDAMLTPLFGEPPSGVTAENIQPRLRGSVLMAISNKEGLLLLTTGNKSEMSVGYATLYGDMCGGYSVLKDIYKTTVYKIARWRNLRKEVIPERILTKPPTAELKPNQTDQDSLPSYEVLDAILLRLVEYQQSVEEVVAERFDRATVQRVARLLFGAEYKRRQAPPGVKITGMSFGRDRRYPITSGWRG